MMQKAEGLLQESLDLLIGRCECKPISGCVHADLRERIRDYLYPKNQLLLNWMETDQ